MVRKLKPMTTMPSTTSTIPVARLRVLASALLAKTATMSLAVMKKALPEPDRAFFLFCR